MRTISYSQMSLFWDCPQKWYKMYIEDYTRPKIPAFEFGSAVHESIAKKLLNYDEHLANDEIERLSNNAIKSLTEFGEFGLNEICVDKENIEFEFEFEVENGKFRGFIDLFFINKYDEHIIVDWKTTSKEYNEHDIKTSNQLTCYAYAYWRLFNIIPNKVCYVTLNKKNFETKLYHDSRKMEDIQMIEKQIVDTLYTMDRMTNHKNEKSCIGDYGKCQFYKQCWNGDIGIIKHPPTLWKISD